MEDIEDTAAVGTYGMELGETASLAVTWQTALQPVAVPPAHRHPARAYLARLAVGSRPAMRGALAVAAELLTGGRCTWETMPWHLLEAQHTKALRAELAHRYAPTTANKMLAAVRGVLREAWELGLVPGEQYHRAT
ncbi:MAG TPA: hypothetical protein VFH60_03520 [Chloroflexia bacterium]|nr:hypothetical protein [Chloroflexia bacterium]